MPQGLREVNIKEDMPAVADAIRRVTFQLNRSKALGFAALKLIHGYGSSGKGGKIRTETRRYLQQQKAKGFIRDFIPGEEFSIFSETTRRAFDACGELRRDSDLNRSNNGVTIVIL
ncbi:MAG: hypothetical protein LBL15_04260 [Oscillospiraceae bacterium]|jgi:hypothetical protein|nr:hypothetical protein [Oscillospiraceae bacterium]